MSRIKAHGAKIYGIDWSHDNRSEIVTCSLDKSIKFWDITKSPEEDGTCVPLASIQTAYPVWRARNLPFGQGVLSLPQRGETALEMWVPDSPNEPIERFEGHADVVKEFVWRKGGQSKHMSLSISSSQLNSLYAIRRLRIPTHNVVQGQDTQVLASRCRRYAGE